MPLTKTCSVSRCGQPDCPECGASPAQRAVFEDLASLLDNFDVCADLEGCDNPSNFDGWFVFSGESADGPAVGYVKPDAEVSWLTH